MNVTREQIDSATEQTNCHVVVLYDGTATRQRAMPTCDYLVKQFWPDVELEFHWWRADFLCDKILASAAGDNAVEADFLIIAVAADQEVASTLEAWFESWLPRRSDRQGALVDLRSRQPTAGSWELFLREIGRRGNFDYLLSILPEPTKPPAATPSPRDFDGIIGDSLGEPRPSSHYGLNE